MCQTSTVKGSMKITFVRKNYNRNYFNSVFCRSKFGSQRNKHRLKEILQHKQGGKMLEVGCGKGSFLNEAKKYFDIEGIDISPYASKKAEKVLGHRVVQGNIRQRKNGILN